VLVNVRSNSGTKAAFPDVAFVPDSDIHHTLFNHFVGVGERLTRARNRSSAQEMLNARWQYCRSAHLFLPDRRHRGREIPVVEAPTRNTKLIWT
jgi:hypothetical protein